MPKFDVTVKLSGTDGNAFAIIGKVSSGIRKAGGTSEDVNEFHEEATSGDYNNVLTTCFKWVNVE
jgi:hypothetical protein